MKINITKAAPTPKDQWEAIRMMSYAQQKLIDALHIMSSALEYNTDEYRDIHERRMKEFIKTFEE